MDYVTVGWSRWLAAAEVSKSFRFAKFFCSGASRREGNVGDCRRQPEEELLRSAVNFKESGLNV
ncbi:hypothetical protein Mapa_004148 [Marchantia paleacea]|nr:hypothetical protein Mapa_004148 [Marchantia paleacea]